MTAPLPSDQRKRTVVRVPVTPREHEFARQRDELGECATRISRERDQQVRLYEAAMNWFPADEWERFEASEEFRAALDERQGE